MCWFDGCRPSISAKARRTRGEGSFRFRGGAWRLREVFQRRSIVAAGASARIRMAWTRMDSSGSAITMMSTMPVAACRSYALDTDPVAAHGRTKRWDLPSERRS